MTRGKGKGRGRASGNSGRGRDGASCSSSPGVEVPSQTPPMPPIQLSRSSPGVEVPSQTPPMPPIQLSRDTDDSPNLANPETTTSQEVPSPSSTRASTTQSQGARLVCFILDGRLFPENTSAQITKIFQQRLFPTGYNWKRVPDGEKKKYFEEFGKVYTWAAEDEIPIRNLFMKQAAIRYRDIVSYWKGEWFKKKKKPSCISEEHWQSWLAYWNEPETVARSKKNSKNRKTEVEVGKGPSKHTGGSKSAVAHMVAMQKERGGAMPSLFDIQKRTHMRKDGTFIDERSRKISEEVERRIAAASTEGDSTAVDTNKIYLEVVGVKKQRIYGVGSLSTAFIEGTQSNASHGSSVNAITQMMEVERADFAQKHEELKQELEQEREIRAKLKEELEQESARMKEALELENARIKHELEQERASREAMKNVMDTQGNQLRILMESLARQGFSV